MTDMITTADIYPVLPELFLAVAAMALLMYGVFRGDKSTGSCSWLAVSVLRVLAQPWIASTRRQARGRQLCP